MTFEDEFRWAMAILLAVWVMVDIVGVLLFIVPLFR